MLSKVLLLLSAALVSAKEEAGKGLEYAEATRIIQSHVNAYSHSDASSNSQRNMCDFYNCCTLSDSESCELSDLKPDQTNLVFPGGESRCIFSTSTPYSFQVIPGDKDKLVVYFQGGGACWTEDTTKLGFCTSDAKPSPLEGIFDRSNVDNKYKDYTIVQLLYCSGDVWGGNVTRSYNDKAGQPVVQSGQFNGQATLDWIKGLQTTSQLSSTLSELVVMGCSAGSIGAQLWGPTVLDTLSWSKASILPDSYAGVFPQGTQGPLIYDYGLCSWNKLPSSLVNDCYAQTLTLQQINAVQLASYNHIPYAFIQSKADIVQQAFYVAIGLSARHDAFITPEIFYEDINTIFSEYNKYNNFLTYLVDGYQHCFTNFDLYYTADGLGPKDGNSANNTGIMLSDWVSEFPLADGEDVDTLCLGEVEDTLKSVEQGDTTYCSSSVIPKSYVESY